MTHYSDEIGFLPVDREIEWDSGKAFPVENLSAIMEEILKETNKDGFVYPVQTNRYSSNPIDKSGKIIPSDELVWIRVPKTRRPALLHKLPISHKIEVNTRLVENDFRNGDGGFLMHFLGFVFGFRLQFKDWWQDGRIYLGGRRWAIVQENVEHKYISSAYSSWRSWLKPERVRFTNLLYMNSRSDTYEWDWERFTINYMVFDGCFEMVRELNGWKRGHHSERFQTLFNYFGIPNKEEDICEIINLRNDLFHESLWEKGEPCSGGTKGYRQTNNLRRINERLITAISGCETEFIQTKWWNDGQYFM